MSYGIQALFGPSDIILGSHVQSLCDALDIPHLEARVDIDSGYKESSLNLHPSQDLMNQAYRVSKTLQCLALSSSSRHSFVGRQVSNVSYCRVLKRFLFHYFYLLL